MPEPFKLLLNAALVERAAARLVAAWPAFPAERFVQLATNGLDDLEMKARAMQICAAFEATLPADFAAAADVLDAAMREPAPLAGWILWSAGEYVARRGLGDPERALALLHTLTQRFSAEFAIRPFIVAHPALAWATFARWVHDESEHVRRLVSEGSRPRLPWGLRLHAQVADPSPALPLLRVLQDDVSGYVRRSVANHLNDIAKDHPDLVAAWLEEHLPGATPERRALLRHASRTLVKQGHRRTLAAWGLGQPFVGRATLAVAPRRVALGAALTITLALGAAARRPQKLVVDYAVHHVKADGSTSPKVFKGWQIELAPREERVLVKRHSLRVVTTRRYHAGEHAVDVLVNGRVVASAPFELLTPRREPR